MYQYLGHQSQLCDSLLRSLEPVRSITLAGTFSQQCSQQGRTDSGLSTGGCRCFQGKFPSCRQKRHHPNVSSEPGSTDSESRLAGARVCGTRPNGRRRLGIESLTLRLSWCRIMRVTLCLAFSSLIITVSTRPRRSMIMIQLGAPGRDLLVLSLRPGGFKFRQALPVSAGPPKQLQSDLDS